MAFSPHPPAVAIGLGFHSGARRLARHRISFQTARLCVVQATDDRDCFAHHLNHPLPTEGSVGKILPGANLNWANDGRNLVRGENVPLATGRRSDSASSEEKSWLLCYRRFRQLDSTGNFEIRGRKKNVIVTPRIEHLSEDPKRSEETTVIRDAVVVPVERGGNAEPYAVLLLNSTLPDDSTATNAVLRQRTLATNQQIGNVDLAGRRFSPHSHRQTAPGTDSRSRQRSSKCNAGNYPGLFRNCERRAITGKLQSSPPYPPISLSTRRTALRARASLQH